MLSGVLHKKGASLASLLTVWAGPGDGPVPLAQPAWGDDTLTRECEFSLYVQTLPNLLVFVTNVCLKVVSDVSVPLLLFVFRFNPHFPLSVQYPEYFQTPTGKRGCYVLGHFSSFFL